MGVKLTASIIRPPRPGMRGLCADVSPRALFAPARQRSRAREERQRSRDTRTAAVERCRFSFCGGSWGPLLAGRSAGWLAGPMTVLGVSLASPLPGHRQHPHASGPPPSNEVVVVGASPPASAASLAWTEPSGGPRCPPAPTADKSYMGEINTFARPGVCLAARSAASLSRFCDLVEPLIAQSDISANPPRQEKPADCSAVLPSPF